MHALLVLEDQNQPCVIFSLVFSKFFSISGDTPEMKPSTRLDKPLQLCSFITEDE